MRILANDYEANLPGSDKLGTGGPARFSKQLALAITEAGHSYTGVTFANRDIKRPLVNTVTSHGHARYLRMRVPNAEYQGITKAKKTIHPLKQLAASIEAFRKVIQNERPDIVFINGVDLRVWTLLVASYLEGVPVVQKYAGIWSKELDAYQHLYSKPAMSAMKAMEKSIPDYATMQVFLNAYCENVFSKEIAASPKNKRTIIPLPVEFSTDKARSAKKTGTVRIGIVARWDRIKNHEAVLALAEEIHRQGLNMEIHAITKIPKTKKFLEFKNRYKTLIKIHPHADAKGVLKFFSCMDIAILPSHFETAGFVVLEAASQGIGTIISKHVGWVDDYKATGNNQWIGDFSKPKTIVKKITELAGKPLSKPLLRKFKKEHDPKRVFNDYLKLFKSLKAKH
ncbi:MAG: glycosyltransferase family 4 protein [Patescibacteria group bacterium]